MSAHRPAGLCLPALVAALVVSGCCSGPAAKPPPEPRTFTRYDAFGKSEHVWTDVDSAGGWIQRSNGWEK